MGKKKEKSNLVLHAERELDKIGLKIDTSDMDGEMRNHILHMVSAFAEEEHSGFSASYASSVLEKLLNYEPLAPLTGEADEWQEVGEGIEQNRRCSHVFRDANGPYDIDGIVFVESEGAAFTSWKSARDIEFPYRPKTVRVPAWMHDYLSARRDRVDSGIA